MQNPVGVCSKFAAPLDPILSALPKDYQGWQPVFGLLGQRRDKVNYDLTCLCQEDTPPQTASHGNCAVARLRQPPI